MTDGRQKLDTALDEFRAVLREAEVRRGKTSHDLRLYAAAMAAGGCGSVGFAPIVVRGARRARPVARGTAALNGAGFVPVKGQAVWLDPKSLGRHKRESWEASAYKAAAAVPTGQKGLSVRAGTVLTGRPPLVGCGAAWLPLLARAGGRRVFPHSWPPVAALEEVSFAPVADARMSEYEQPALAVKNEAADPVMRWQGTGRDDVAFGLVERGAPERDSQGPMAGARWGVARAPLQAAQGLLPAERPSMGLTQPEIESALEDYFFRKSRLPPAGGAGFNPFLSPVWAGMKIPG